MDNKPIPWPERCEHEVVIPDGEHAQDVCEDCREHIGSVQAEGSVGK